MKRPLLLLIVLLSATPLFAHREDFVGETLVFLTLERHALEPEAFIDWSQDERFYNAAVEYGVTDHFMVDGRVTSTGNGSIDAARVETRYRFGEEGTWPVDTAVSFEANVERENGEDHYGIEPRLILSKDVDRFNFTVNVADEIPTNGGAPALQIAGGARFDATELLRVGSELRWDEHDHSGTVVPQVWFVLPHETTLRLGYFAGFRGAPHFVRFGIELEF